MLEELLEWKSRAEEVAGKLAHGQKALRPYLALLNFIHASDWQGACHASCAVLYVLFREKGLDVQLCVGECKIGPHRFDHSWLTLDEFVFDAAISLPLDSGIPHAPTFNNVDLATGLTTNVEYGIGVDDNLDMFATGVAATPFLEYMSNFGGHKDGLWGLAKTIGDSAGLNLNVRLLREKYASTQWALKRTY